MLSTLAIGLASGVGLYVMAALSAAFILGALWVVESFEPEGRKLYSLSIKMGDDTDAKRPQFEAILQRHHVDFALQTVLGRGAVCLRGLGAARTTTAIALPRTRS